MNLRELVGSYNAVGNSYASLVPWFEQVTPGLVINHDGSLLAAFEYEGLDFDSTNSDDHDVATQTLETAFGAFDNRNILWTFLDKRRRVFVKNSDIGNPVARFVEQQWLDATDDGSLASFRHVICVAYQAFSGAGSFFDEVGAVMAGGKKNLAQAMAEVGKQTLLMKSGIEKVDGKIVSGISSFEGQLASFAQVLPRLKFERIEGNRLLAELSNRINLASPRSTVSIPSEGPVYLNTLLTTDTLQRIDGGVLKFIGAEHQRYVSMLSVKGYPGIVRNDHAEELLMVGGDYTVAQMYRFLDREKAKSLVMKAEQHYRSQVKGPITQMVEKMTGEQSERINTGNLVLAEDAQAALVEITADSVNFGYHSMAVQVIGYDQQDMNTVRKKIAGVLSNAGYGVVNEVIHQVGAFSATIPGASDTSVRSTLVSTRNLADMAVVRSIQPGSPVNHYLSEQRKVTSPALCLFPTPSGVPELFNFHVGDVGHFMVVGPSGGGKT
ncbi:MAG: VirB4 family type IV secretion system protein, partial [Longimicrobiales bacterium]